MNASIYHASATTHLKIVATALLTSVVVVWIGIATCVSQSPTAPHTIVKAGPSMFAAIDEDGRI